MTKPLYPAAKLAPNYGDEWDEHQDERLRDCALGGLSRKEAALLLGRTVTAIKGRSQALGLRFTRDTYGGSLRPYDIRLPNEARAEMEERDNRMVQALALAIYRGEHLTTEQRNAAAA